MTKYFVTGATGFVGSAVVDELLANGYKVLGLARSDKSAEALKKKGAEVLRGDLEDLESIKKGASETDGTLHLGFIHDFTNFPYSLQVDRKVTNTIIEALKGTNKVFINTNGFGGQNADVIGQITETIKVDLNSIPPERRGRLETEQITLESSKDGIRSISIRLSPTVHDVGDQGFVPILIRAAAKGGAAYYVNEGKAKWPAVHRLDAARLYRQALEKGEAGSVYHAVGDEGVETKLIAEAIAEKLKIGTQSLSFPEAGEKLGFIGFILGTNLDASSEKTKKDLGWTPKEIGLLEDIKKHYENTEINKLKV